MPTLDWIGKQAVVNHQRQVPVHLLRRVPELSVGDSGNGNLLVEGDNLIALKALLPYYAGKVKCIYIDPPYNTGKENWVYNDNVNSPIIREWLGKVVGKESEDLSRHDKWLCMMFPRLQLLRQFLRSDGLILISIDDHEIHRLRCVMDEIFGTSNFIAQLVWDKTRKNDAKLFSVGHEYMVIYARSLSTLRKLKTIWRESKPGADEIIIKYKEIKDKYNNSDYPLMEEELRVWYKNLPKNHPSKKLSRYKHIDALGVWRDRDISWPGGSGPRYDVLHPVTGKPCKVPERGWGFASPKAMDREIKKGLVQFRENELEPPFRKAYLMPIAELSDEEETFDENENEEELGEELFGAQVMPSIIYKQAQVVVKFLRNLFGGEKVFDNPKDHEIILRLIRYVTGLNDIILDAFAGSGSTGHAVLQLNKETGSNRKFILVEMDKIIFKDILQERLIRAIKGYSYQTRKKEIQYVAGLGGGFECCSLGNTLFDEKGKIAKEVSFPDLATHIYFTETGEPLPETVSGESPLIGVHNGTAVYLLYNGVLADKKAQGGNVLTRAVLASLPPHFGAKVIYGTGCRLGEERLRRENIRFRQIPYEVKVD